MSLEQKAPAANFMHSLHREYKGPKGGYINVSSRVSHDAVLYKKYDVMAWPMGVVRDLESESR